MFALELASIEVLSPIKMTEDFQKQYQVQGSY